MPVAQENQHHRIAVLGAGSWGTALAMLLGRNGHATALWGRDPAQMEAMAAQRCNTRYLPGLVFPENTHPVSDLGAAIQGSKHLLLACPSDAFVALLEQIVPLRDPGQPLFWATKGFEPGSGRLLHEVVRDRLGEHTPMGIVTGPSFATEVARGLPTAATVASPDAGQAQAMAALLHGEDFRAYTSTDIIGAEIGGAVKNVLAVATGVADGMGLGDNARSGLITRGLAEIMRLGVAMGAQAETLMGLSGVGDLVLTCTGDLSRNRRFGLALGRGISAADALAEIGQVVEGVKTAVEVHRLAQKLGVDMPIAEVTYAMVHEGISPQDGLHALLSREAKPETA